jgi:hypothetical protein
VEFLAAESTYRYDMIRYMIYDDGAGANVLAVLYQIVERRICTPLLEDDGGGRNGWKGKLRLLVRLLKFAA